MPEQKYPEPTIGALIFNPDGKLFLLKSHKWKDKYTIPGGHVELGETIEDALKREIKEETGLDIYDIEFICLQEFIFDDQFWKKKHFIFLDFSCKTNSTEVKLDSEGQDYVWASLEGALKLPIDSYSEFTIKDYMKNKLK